MAITAVGFDGTVSETQFARLTRYHNEVNYRHGVVTGMNVSVGGGTRQASVSTGTAVMPGLLVDSDSAATATFGANSGGSNRIDYLVLRANWVTNVVDVTVIAGSSSTTPPALTQTEGTTWHMPLARVTVRPSVTTLLDSDIEACKPLPRVTRYASDTVATAVRAYNAAELTVGTINFTDPGWPYRLHVMASARFDGGTTLDGYANVYLRVNGLSGTVLGKSASGWLGLQGDQTVTAQRTSAVLTGAALVEMRIDSTSMTSGNSLELLFSDVNDFAVHQIPV